LWRAVRRIAINAPGSGRRATRRTRIYQPPRRTQPGTGPFGRDGPVCGHKAHLIDGGESGRGCCKGFHERARGATGEPHST